VFGTQRGLGLWGPTGRGKTRAMYAILKRLHFAGVRCYAVQAIQFAEAAMLIAERAPWSVREGAVDLIRRCHAVPVLLFDDLGKENSTPAVAKAMHALVEDRKAHQRTLLWTSERTADELAQFLGVNFADGIVRRIGEITRVFHTEDAIPTAAATSNADRPISEHAEA
jgi:DNA replication protein DnaC